MPLSGMVSLEIPDLWSKMDKKAKTTEQKCAILDTVGVSRIVQKNK